VQYEQPHSVLPARQGPCLLGCSLYTHSVRLFPTHLENELMKTSHRLCARFLPVINQDDVHACYSTMLSESSSPTPSKLADKRPPPSSSGSTTYESVDAASSFAATAGRSKRARLEMPSIGP
jgi:hypothetical protein